MHTYVTHHKKIRLSLEPKIDGICFYLKAGAYPDIENQIHAHLKTKVKVTQTQKLKILQRPETANIWHYQNNSHGGS